MQAALTQRETGTFLWTTPLAALSSDYCRYGNLNGNTHAAVEGKTQLRFYAEVDVDYVMYLQGSIDASTWLTWYQVTIVAGAPRSNQDLPAPLAGLPLSVAVPLLRIKLTNATITPSSLCDVRVTLNTK